MLSARAVTLDDWGQLRFFFEQFQKSKYASRLELDVETLQSYFLLSLTSPRTHGLYVAFQNTPSSCGGYDTFYGFGIIYEISQNVRNQVVRRSWVHSVYILPKDSRNVGSILNSAAVLWSKERQHASIDFGGRATARNAFKTRAVSKKYGYELAYQVYRRTNS